MENTNLLEVELYTDGACSYNPGPGGWGCVLLCKTKQKNMSGYMENTTNNQMEITAVIEGVKALKKPCKLKLYTDSNYVYSIFTQGWLENWKKNGFKNASNKPVKNIELILELENLLSKFEVEWVKVKGHADNYYNNLCDKLATDEIKKNAKPEN